jgi:hypothetical protein
MRNRPTLPSWALGFYAYPSLMPDHSLFRSFASLCDETFAAWGSTVTYIAAGGGKHSGEFQQVKRTWDERIDLSAYSAASLLVLATCATDRPAYDSIADGAICWRRDSELMLRISARESITHFKSTEFTVLSQRLLQWYPWSFAYAVCGDYDKTGVHVTGTSNGRLTPSEERALDQWYAADSRTRQALPRDIYQLNIWNDQQMTAATRGVSIAALLRSYPNISIQRIGELSVVTVPPQDVLPLRMRLGDAGLLIAPNIHGL